MQILKTKMTKHNLMLQKLHLDLVHGNMRKATVSFLLN